jgi:hypothetical protein
MNTHHDYTDGPLVDDDEEDDDDDDDDESFNFEAAEQALVRR